MIYDDKIENLLEIEKKILKIYDKLINNSLKTKNKEYMKEFNNLNLLLEYENEKLNSLYNIDIKKLDFYLKYNDIDFNFFDSDILNKKDLYRYRLAYNIINNFSDDITLMSKNDLSELYINYIWNIENDKNELMNLEINKIQYYICYVDKTLETFFMDNIFSFNKPYNNISFTNIDKNNNAYRLCKMNAMNHQLTYGLNKIKEIIRENPNNKEYIYYKNFVKSVIHTVNEQDFRSYINIITEHEPNKLLLLSKVLGD